VPWCETCDRFYNPNSLEPDGTCPTCGREVADPSTVATATDDRVPWHFKLLVVGVVGYLGWRFVELVGAIVS
jgi:hypothetical protein